MRDFDRIFLQKRNEVKGFNHIGILKFDMDDVKALFGKSFINLYNNTYNDNLTSEDMKNWDMTTFVKPEVGAKVYELLKEPGLFRFLEPSPDAQNVIQRLINKGFEILVVSDSPAGHSFTDFQSNPTKFANPADDKRAWLLEHFPMISKENVIFCSQKDLVRGDILIDDKPDTFLIHQKMGMDVLLMDRPYNRHIETSNRVYSMLDAEQKIYEMFNLK